ncbi:hypothetical protein C0J52_23425, partial [Blattella germanica]
EEQLSKKGKPRGRQPSFASFLILGVSLTKCPAFRSVLNHRNALYALPMFPDLFGLPVDGGCMPGLSAFLSILSLAANLGNVLRLPRVVFLSGGGTFLVVYICINLIFGIPLVFLEIGLGQFCQEGTTKLWRAVPLFKGVGYVKVLASGLVSVYYPVLMGLSLFYMVWCGKGPVPFEECAHDFTKIVSC